MPSLIINTTHYNVVVSCAIVYIYIYLQRITMCPHGYHHSGSMAYIYIYIYVYIDFLTLKVPVTAIDVLRHFETG